MAAALLCSALPAWSQELPEGQGKEMVAALCNSCHPFYARLGGGYTAEGWRTVMRMMANHGVNMPADQVATITEYLRSEEHTSELQSQSNLVCRLLLEKKKKKKKNKE